jgi:membrane associated rhomboid family serine protease
MNGQLFDHSLLLAAVVCASTLVRLLRRNDGIGRGYALLVGGELLLAVLAIGGNHFLGMVTLCLVVMTVVLPWLLEHGSRWAFARGHLIWVGRMSSLRASLMPGSGLARQMPIIEGLALLERKGVDAALARFRRLADEAEEPAELATIHEQIVSMLFLGQRWDEGIAHYERRFQAGYAAVRPSLALGLLRAYGEAGRLETAAKLLRELEDGPVGADPSRLELLGQARLTFLAYAGAIEPIDEFVERRHFVELGLSPATAELFKGIAHARAGEPRVAVETLSKVESLAGPRDRRVLEAARSVLERVGLALNVNAGTEGATSEPGTRELGPELRSYVELVAFRLRAVALAMPPLRRYERPLASYAVIVLLSTVYGMHMLRGGGGIGLLELGALSRDLAPDLATGGVWSRVFTSVWLHGDIVGLLFDAYAIWLAGQLVERMLGPARMLLITVGAALAGVTASVLALGPLTHAGLDELAVLAPTGGNLMAVGSVSAALWLLTPKRTPALASRPRRNLIVTLALLLLANLITTWPTIVGVGVAPVALFTTIVVASLVVLVFPRELSRAAELVLMLVLGVMLAANAVAAVRVVAEDPQTYLVDHRVQRCEVDGVVVHTPSDLVPMWLDRDVPFELPIFDGLLDTLELRDGSLVQLAVVRGSAASSESLAVFGLAEGLEREFSVTAAGPLPEPFAELIAADAQGHWRTADLWRNGERVARVIERRLDVPAGREAATISLIAAPPEAMAHAPAIHAAILREAKLAAVDGERTQCTTAR